MWVGQESWSKVACAHFSLQIIDNDGNILPPNTEGSIGVRIKPFRPAGVFVCYEVRAPVPKLATGIFKSPTKSWLGVSSHKA